jgi:hypothetical protein
MPASPPARRFRAALRSLNPTPVLTLALALVLGGAGGAAAATGGNFILGKANTETATATLSNTKGTPLRLTAPFGTPPLTVNKTDSVIPNLDAQFAGGFTGNQMANFGGDGFTTTQTTFNVLTMATETDPLPAGTYYVTATAWLDMPPDDGGGTCWIAKGSDPSTAINLGSEDRTGEITLAETAVASMTLNDTLQEWCETSGTSNAVLASAGITAIRIAFSLGTPPARAGIPVKTALRQLARSGESARPSS